MADNNSAQFEENMRSINEELVRFNLLLRNGTDESSEALDDLAAAAKSASDQEKQLKALRQSAWQNLKDGTRSFKDSLLQAEGGLTKYNSGLKSVGDSAWQFGKSLGPLGMAVGGLVKAFTFLAGQANRYNEALLNNFNALSDTGITAGIVSDDLLDMANKVGLTSHNMELLFKNSKDLGSDFLALGNTASQGMKAFAELSATTEQQRKIFRSLGLSEEEVIKINAQFVRQAVAAGENLAKSPKELQRRSQEYVKQLITLAELTGIDVKKQQAAIDFANAQENYNQYVFDQQLQRKRLQDEADRTSDETQKKQLLAQADAITAQLKAKDEFIRGTANYNQETRTAILQTIATTSDVGILTERTAQFKQVGINMDSILAGLNRGQSQLTNFQEQNAQAMERFSQTYGTLVSTTGDAGIQIRQTFGVYNESIAEATRFRQLATKEEKELYEKERKAAEARIAKKLAGQGPEDKAVEIDSARRETERKAREAEDAAGKLSRELTQGVMVTFIEMVGKAAEVVKNMITSIENFVVKIKEAVGNMFSGVSNFVTSLGGLLKTDQSISGTQSTSVPTSQTPQTTQEPTSRFGSIQRQKFAMGAAGRAAAVTTNDPESLLQFTARSGSKDNFEKLNGAIKNRVLAAASEYNSITGKKFIINSGFRDPDDQVRLWNETLKRGTPGISPEGNRVAPPGSSRHERGLAVDIQNYDDPAAVAALNKQGLFNPIPSDKPHFQLAQAALGGIFSGPRTGYPIEMHGTEMVTPLDANSILAKLAQTSASEIQNQLQTQSTMSTEMVSVLVEKLNDMIDRLDNSNDIQNQLLTYARV